MSHLINLISKHLLDDNEREREKTSFWPTESEANAFDIYHKWMGTPPTNPITGEKLMMFQSAKLIEQAYVNMFADMGILLSSEENQTRIEIERNGIPISGYMDAVLDYMGHDMVCEIKTFYGDWQERDLLAGKPRESYLKQLAVYMDATDTNEGLLFYINRGTGKPFQYLLQRSGTKFKCNDIEFDIMDTYKRWADIYDYIQRGEEPPSDYIYKFPLEEIDWKTISRSDISKARNGHKVLGEWQVLYSPYKDLIVEREGTQLGYSPEEIALIKEKTDGYTTWR
jgi:hypothetical protein|tara:strand:+ start:1273 stop:2121 length:849 start_codon:yes stop_codon:yes gene_type:complete